MIKPYLSGIINDYRTQGEWEIYLIMTNNFFVKRFWNFSWLAQSHQKWQAIFRLGQSQINV